MHYLELIDYLVTFLMGSGATISVVCLDALTADLRSQITTSRLTTPFGANGSPHHGRASENSSYQR